MTYISKIIIIRPTEECWTKVNLNVLERRRLDRHNLWQWSNFAKIILGFFPEKKEPLTALDSR